MFSVKVKGHIMIAHSLPDEFFGPAKHMHGATFVTEVTFRRKTMTDKNVVIDIGEASEILERVLDKLNYRNLDEIEEFKGKLTTTEFLAHYIHAEIKKQLSEPLSMKVELHESHVASASFED